MSYEPTEEEIEEADRFSDEYDYYLKNLITANQPFEHWKNNIPPIIFKYRNFKNFEYTEDIFVNDRLYLPFSKDLNDPFEGGNVDYISEIDREKFYDNIKKCRILSLSQDCFSAPLWAHYAAECSGICIGFTTFETFKNIVKIEYENTIDKKLWWSVDPENAFEKEFLYKYEDWSYEKEYRLIERENDPYLHFKPYEMSVIIFGQKIDIERKENLMNIMPDNCIAFDIKTDKNRSRYYLTRCDSDEKPIYTLDELYNIVLKNE